MAIDKMYEAKKAAALAAAQLVTGHMTIGLGTGSTAKLFVEAVGARVREGLHVRAVASSLASESLAREQGIEIVEFAAVQLIDLTVDGADQADKQFNLIKGGGGALLREKILAYNSKRFVVVLDDSKLVDSLQPHPVPVEIIPFAHELTLRQLAALGAVPKLRQQGGDPFITDNGNLIADCVFDSMGGVAELNRNINALPGVVESGLFEAGRISQVIAGYNDGRIQTFDLR